jgi:hypothetical protein
MRCLVVGAPLRAPVGAFCPRHVDPWLIVLLLILSRCEQGREDHRADATFTAERRFDDLAKVCADHFGEPRQDGTSHKVYKTPWQGDPRVNIQRGKDGNAKAYQVRQVLDAIARLEAEKNEESDNDA